jgi:hypothetical protein
MEARLEADEEKMDGQHARVNKALDTLYAWKDHAPTVFVSRESLKYQLDNFSDRFEPLLTSAVWLMRLVVGGFIAALAQYVYVHAK